MFEIWIYRSIIGLLLAVVWWVIKKWTSNIIIKFDLLIDEVKKLSEKNAVQDNRMSTLEGRTNDHAERIRELERRQ